MLIHSGASVTCDVSRARGIEWFLIKGSRGLPDRRSAQWRCDQVGDLYSKRYVGGILYVQISGAFGEFELLAACLARSTLGWLVEEIAREAVTCVRQRR